MHTKTKQEKDKGACGYNITDNQRKRNRNLHKRIPGNHERGETGHNTLPPCNCVSSLCGKVQQTLTCSVISGHNEIVSALLEWTQRMSKGSVYFCLSLP